MESKLNKKQLLFTINSYFILELITEWDLDIK